MHIFEDENGEWVEDVEDEPYACEIPDDYSCPECGNFTPDLSEFVE